MITAEDIRTLFGGPLDLIENAELREKVVDAWVTGCERGGWESVKQLSDMPFTLLTECHGINFIEHTVAVTLGAWALARAQVDAYAAVFAVMDNVGTVTGTVTDAGSSTPLAGVEIRDTRGFTRTETDAGGVYGFNLLSGATVLTAEGFGYLDSELNITVPNGAAVLNLDIPMVAMPPGIVSGAVSGPGGSPVAGATISVLGTPVAPVTRTRKCDPPRRRPELGVSPSRRASGRQLRHWGSRGRRPARGGDARRTPRC